MAGGVVLVFCVELLVVVFVVVVVVVVALRLGVVCEEEEVVEVEVERDEGCELPEPLLFGGACLV